MDAVVAAGGNPDPDDPLYAYTQGRPKALLEIAGKPMIQWVLDALSGAESVERIVVVGLDAPAGLSCGKPVAYVPDQEGLLRNIRAGAGKVLELNPAAEFVLSVSSDIPAITSEMVDWLVNAALESDHDLYYCVVPREVMEARFPQSRRSYVRLKDAEVCGGDMNVFRAALAISPNGLWERLIDARKNALKQAALMGYDTVLLLLLRRLTVQRAVQRAGERLGIRGRALVCPFAEIGMDVDKPAQLEILRADLASKTMV